MSKTVFGQDFFLQNFQKNRSDVNGAIIILENTFLLQPFFQFVQIRAIFMLAYIKENANK
jgi:hypothetical protein